MAFCDYCKCGNCEHGAPWLAHAPTADGRWICNVCWRYDMCTRKDAPNRSTSGPCEHEDGSPVVDCRHRPRLVGDWVGLTADELQAMADAGIKHYAEGE